MISLPAGGLHAGFPLPAVFQEGISYCDCCCIVFSPSSLVPPREFLRQFPANDVSHLNWIHIILITSTNWSPCSTQINMIQSVSETFQRRAATHACHLTFPIHIGLHNTGSVRKYWRGEGSCQSPATRVNSISGGKSLHTVMVWLILQKWLKFTIRQELEDVVTSTAGLLWPSVGVTASQSISFVRILKHFD